MKYSFSLALLCFQLVTVLAQNNSDDLKPLQIGEQVPDIEFGPIQNYNRSTSEISDFKGKLVIFDFWGTYCQGCIEAFPKLDSLQKIFGADIQIILVNRQRLTTIDSFFAFRKRLQYKGYDLPNLPLVTGDRILEKLFPHTLIPHEVWVSPEGKLCAVTRGQYLTRENVAKKLADPFFALPQKLDLLTHDAQKALLPQVYDNQKSVLNYYSCIMRNVEGLDGTSYRYVVNSAARTVRMTRAPGPILMMYADALSHFDGFAYPYDWYFLDYGKRVLLEVKDSSRFIRPAKFSQEWTDQNCFGYEAVLPLEQKDRLYEFMLDDLDKYFGLHGRVEKRVMKCLAIVRTDSTEKFKSPGSRRLKPRPRPDTSIHYHLYDGNMALFRDHLSKFNRYSDYVFADNTQYKGYIDLELSVHLNNIQLLRKELREKYGLDIVEKIQPVDVMVITENGYRK